MVVLLLVSLVAGAILTAAEGRNFASSGNISAILTGTSILGFIAVGQTLVILVGSLDLSVPFVASLTSVLAAGYMDGDPANVVPAVAARAGRRGPDRPGQRADRQLPARARLHRHARHGPDHQRLPRRPLPGQPRRGPALVPAARRHAGRPGPALDADHARLRGRRDRRAAAYPPRPPHLRRRRQPRGRPALRHPHLGARGQRPRPLLGPRRVRRPAAARPARRRQPDHRQPGRLRPDVHRGGRPRRHPARRRQGQRRRHARRRRDLRGARQRHGRHAGQPVPQGRVRGVVIVVAVALYARREIDRRPARFEGART